MFIPLRDDNPTTLTPVVTVSFIALCVLVSLYQLGLGDRAGQALILGYGMIPSVLFGTRELAPAIPTIEPWLTLFTSMFLHGGLMHLAGNMIFLWVFGNNIEDAMGHVRFIAFYLLCGVAAAFAQALIDPDAEIPMVGASGAISGVLGAYLLLHPHARVQVLVVYGLITTVNLPAMAVLGWWIAIQLISLFLSDPAEGGVAWYAHVGGFVAGLALVPVFRRRAPAGWNQPPGPRRGPWG